MSFSTVTDLASNKDFFQAIAAGTTSLLVLLLGAVLTQSSERRQRRRELFAEAYKAVLSWNEMLYRVRRRTNKEEDNLALVNRFHELQEQINFHQGWLSTESYSLGQSYYKFSTSVKSKIEEEIQKAWASPPIEVGHPARVEDLHPDISQERNQFLSDVRAHLSPWYLPYSKICLFLRYKERPKAITNPLIKKEGGNNA